MPRRAEDTTVLCGADSWLGTWVFCSCGAVWHGRDAIGNPEIVDHRRTYGHTVSDRPWTEEQRKIATPAGPVRVD